MPSTALAGHPPRFKHLQLPLLAHRTLVGQLLVGLLFRELLAFHPVEFVSGQSTKHSAQASGTHRDFSLSALVAGLIATLISYAGPLVIIFQAAKSAGLPDTAVSSWVWAISIGSGVLGILLSLRYKVPLVIAWSAPGSALLVALLPGISLNEAVGAYLASSLIIFLVGISGAFDRVVGKLPPAISAAMRP